VPRPGPSADRAQQGDLLGASARRAPRPSTTSTCPAARPGRGSGSEPGTDASRRHPRQPGWSHVRLTPAVGAARRNRAAPAPVRPSRGLETFPLVAPGPGEQAWPGAAAFPGPGARRQARRGSGSEACAQRAARARDAARWAWRSLLERERVSVAVGRRSHPPRRSAFAVFVTRAGAGSLGATHAAGVRSLCAL
jgi:hypothetical protein